MTVYTKDPDAEIDYALDWDDFYLADGETIPAGDANSVWSVVPAGLTIDSETHTTSVTTVWVSGGTAGVAYRLTNRIITDASRTEDRSIIVKVQER